MCNKAYILSHLNVFRIHVNHTQYDKLCDKNLQYTINEY